MRVFGCECFAHVPKQKRLKLDDSGVKCRFLGYLENQKGYRLLNLETGSITNARSVTFVELAGSSGNVSGPEAAGPGIDTECADKRDNFVVENTEGTGAQPTGHQLAARRLPEQQQLTTHEPPGTQVVPYEPSREECVDIVPTDLEESMSPRMTGRRMITSVPSGTPGRDGESQRRVRPARKKRGVTRYEDEFSGMRRGEFNDDDFEGEFDGLFCLTTALEDEKQTTYGGIMKSEFKSQWKEAMNAEMRSLVQHVTWELVDLPPGKKLIGSRWLFKIKRNADGSVNKFKARLVAQGFTQQMGVDFFETFAPVAKQATVRVLLAVAAELDYDTEQFDVDTAFLYAPMEDEVYIRQPDGYEDETHPEKVCRLLKSLYGTKQAARQWNKTLDNFFRSVGFERSEADPCLYTRINESEYVAVAVYVDDMIVVSQTSESMRAICDELKKVFSIKELGEPRYILGIEVTRDRRTRTLTLSQRGYIQQLAEKFRVSQAKPVYLPADANSRLSQMADGDVCVTQFPYRELVGSLMYIVTCTRPDIADAVGNVAKFCERHNNEHWAAARRILKFLATTQDLALVYDGQQRSGLVGYADASWASDEDTRRSTTGYVFTYNGTAVSWRSQRQPTVAGSSTEAEYMALYAATQELVWLRRLLKDLKALRTGPTTVFQDNQGAIAMAKNPVFNSRTKHIDTKYHFSRERIESNELQVIYKPTGEMVADALTKAVPRPKLSDFQDAVGLKRHTA
ncbi:hypothetical protein Gpo141_00014172 [Globisporangium polare]